LPHLLARLSASRGDLHSHATWSDVPCARFAHGEAMRREGLSILSRHTVITQQPAYGQWPQRRSVCALAEELAQVQAEFADLRICRAGGSPTFCAMARSTRMMSY
jgi:hypothetical protein